MNYSKQRESIKEYLMSTKVHPTAEVIYKHVKHENPTISLATVYRNLTLLVDNGDVRKISFGDGTEHYDGDTSPHSHYMCRCCHTIYDLDVVCSAEQVLSVSKMDIGTVENANMIFSGVCRQCLNNQ